MDFEEFSRKRAILEKGMKRVQIKFVLIPVLFGAAVVNLFGVNTLEHMLGAAIVVGLVIGVPMQILVSKKIDNVARELGFKCEGCGKTLPLKKLNVIASSRKCPDCRSQVIN